MLIGVFNSSDSLILGNTAKFSSVADLLAFVTKSRLFDSILRILYK